MVTALIRARLWFPAIATPFLAIDCDKVTTSGTRIGELHAWYRSNFSDTLLNTRQLASKYNVAHSLTGSSIADL